MCFRVHALGVGWDGVGGGVLNGFRDLEMSRSRLESGVCVYVKYIRIRIILLVSL